MRLRNLIQESSVDSSVISKISSVKILSLEIRSKQSCQHRLCWVQVVLGVAKIIPHLCDRSEVGDESLEMPYSSSIREAHNGGPLDKFSARSRGSKAGEYQGCQTWIDSQQNREHSVQPAFGICPHHHKHGEAVQELFICFNLNGGWLTPLVFGRRPEHA